MIRCLMCGAPVENEERNWFDPGETNRRVWLCNFHHEPFRTGEAWIEKNEEGRYVMMFKRSVPVARFLL